MPIPTLLVSATLQLTPLAPLAVVSIVWTNEATWFQSYQSSAAALIVAFCAFVGVAVLGMSCLALGRVQRPLSTISATVGLALVALVFAQLCVRALVAWGYSIELNAYTNLVSLVASKQGQAFVLAVAAIPLLARKFHLTP